MRGRIASLIGLFCMILWTGQAESQATIGGKWRDDVAQFAERVVRAGLTPGMAVAVSQGDWILYSQGFGVADAASGRTVDETTPFYIASTSKALTATAVLLQSAKGVIDLGAPIDRYVPGLRFYPPMDAHRITVEQLLTMTEGLEDGGPVIVRTAYTGEFTTSLLLDLLADYGPDPDGQGFSYGNLPYNILGLALDPTSEEGWKEVVKRDVLAPLEMNNTTARISEMDPRRLALPHGFTPNRGWNRLPLAKADANQHAAGGHFATAVDLVRFVAAHASGGLLEGRRVFPRGVIETAAKEHVEQERQFGPFRRFGWGYGWDLGAYEGRTIVHRFGAFPGYRSHASFEPDSEVGVVVLVNGNGPASAAADLMATYIYDRMLGREVLEAEYDRRLAELERSTAEGRIALAGHMADRADRSAPLSHPLPDYAGVFENQRFGTMTWRVVAGGLEVRMGVAESRAEVFDAESDELRVELFGGGSIAAFEFPADGGPATAITMNGERFERAEGNAG